MANGLREDSAARRKERTLSKALTFSAAGKVYCVKTCGPGTARRGARLTLPHFPDGAMPADFKNRSLADTYCKTNPGPDPAGDEKTRDARMILILAGGAARPQAQPVSPQGRG